MNEKEIRDLYDRLIAHYAESHDLPKLTRLKPSFVILDKDDKRSRFYEKTGNVIGTWSSDLWDSVSEDTIQSPCIEFYGEPTIETVMHELIHHMIFIIDRCYITDEYHHVKPKHLIIADAIAEEPDLKCPKCDSHEVEKEKNVACLCWQCVCKVCGHSWIEERDV